MAKRKPITIFCSICACVVLAVVIIAIILAFTVFKPKKPETHVDDVTLESFKASLRSGFNLLDPSINITLGLVISVYNPNSASFKYKDSFTSVLYHDVEVARVPIPEGHIGAKSSETIKTSLALYADKLLTDSSLLPDFLNGSLPFTTSTDLSGRVKIFIISRHVRISSKCTFSISVTKQSVDSTDCQNNVSL